MTSLASVVDEKKSLVSGSSFLALVPRLGGDSVAEKALVAETFSVSRSSSSALVPSLASIEVGLLVSVAEKAVVA